MALSAGILVVFFAEMRRFVKPGGATINLAGAVFSMTYVGMMIGFLIQLRMAWGVLAVISVILIVKIVRHRSLYRWTSDRSEQDGT